MTTRADHDSLQPGDPRELGPYRLLARLGRGGMGTVFLGEDAGGRRVAVKVINRELAGEATFLDRFRREVTAARQVRRFCTAPVVDAQIDADPLYVVTEYIEGPSLERAVAERGPLPGSDLEALAVGVATALAAVHGAGIVHRDLKPANVLLSSLGPRVIDFGIARALDAADGPTRTGQFVGTPAYIAPEILRGEPVREASDVFSWGCVVAYAGTGRAPFAGNTVPEILYRVVHEPPVLGNLDPGLRNLVEAALSKDPNARPAVRELLGRLVGHAEVNPAQIAETLQATWPAPGATAVSGGAASWPTVTSQAGPTRGDGPFPAPAPAPRPAGRSRKPLVLGLAAAAVAVVAVAGVAVYSLFGSDGPPEDTSSYFSDAFSDNTSGWYTDSDQKYVNGRFRAVLTNNEDFNITSSPLDTDTKTLPKRQLVTAKATVVSGPDYGQFGLFCNGSQATSEESGYLFLVRKDGKGALLRKMSPGWGDKELTKTGDTGGFEAGKTNRLQIACEAENSGKAMALRMWVNGSQVLSYTDDDHIVSDKNSGLVLAWTSQSQQNLLVDYDDFEIAEING